MDGVKKSLPKKFLIKGQILFLSKLKMESFVEASLLRVGVAVVHGLTTMQLLYSISTINSLQSMIMRYALPMMVSGLVVASSQLEAIN